VPLDQQDLEAFAEKLAAAMVKAHCEALTQTDTFTKIKKGAANMSLSAAGALVAFMMLSWFGEYREQATTAAGNAKDALAAAKDAQTNARAARSEAITVIDSSASLDAKITTLTDKLAELQARQKSGNATSEIPATSFQESRDEILRAQDKAIYRQRQVSGSGK
jgi:hypothetical protein